MTTELPIDESWSALMGLPESERAAAMERRFTQLSVLGKPERVDAIEAMIRAEFSLTDEQVHQFTASRLRVWAALHRRDPGQAKEIVDGYDTAMDRMPATLAMRRGGVLYTVAREMAPEEVAALHELIPSLRQSVPFVKPGFVEREREAVEAARDRTPNKKPFWKFWG